MIPTLLGLLALGIVFVVAQERFYTAYGRRYGLMRPLSKRLFGPNPEEFREMLAASFRRDPDANVERARRIYMVALGALLGFGLWGVLTGNLYGR